MQLAFSPCPDLQPRPQGDCCFFISPPRLVTQEPWVSAILNVGEVSAEADVEVGRGDVGKQIEAR